MLEGWKRFFRLRKNSWGEKIGIRKIEQHVPFTGRLLCVLPKVRTQTKLHETATGSNYDAHTTRATTTFIKSHNDSPNYGGTTIGYTHRKSMNDDGPII
jgi:hypothetical protein